MTSAGSAGMAGRGYRVDPTRSEALEAPSRTRPPTYTDSDPQDGSGALVAITGTSRRTVTPRQRTAGEEEGL